MKIRDVDGALRDVEYDDLMRRPELWPAIEAEVKRLQTLAVEALQAVLNEGSDWDGGEWYTPYNRDGDWAASKLVALGVYEYERPGGYRVRRKESKEKTT